MNTTSNLRLLLVLVLLSGSVSSVVATNHVRREELQKANATVGAGQVPQPERRELVKNLFLRARAKPRNGMLFKKRRMNTMTRIRGGKRSDSKSMSNKNDTMKSSNNSKSSSDKTAMTKRKDRNGDTKKKTVRSFMV